nr:MAG TPA: hypothetical protein [Caudoviricetes sp.]
MPLRTSEIRVGSLRCRSATKKSPARRTFSAWPLE